MVALYITRILTGADGDPEVVTTTFPTSVADPTSTYSSEESVAVIVVLLPAAVSTILVIDVL
jgi:hypothetical protein